MDWLYPIFGFAGKQYDKQTSEAARGFFLKNATLLEEVLQNGRAYLVGQKLSLADVVVAAQLIPSYLVVRAPAHESLATSVIRAYTRVRMLIYNLLCNSMRQVHVSR